MANIFDVYNGDVIANHTEKDGTDGFTDLVISNLTPETTYDKFSVAYAGKTTKTPVPSFTTAKAAAVLMTSFSLDKTEITGKVGDTVTVTLSNELPSNATNKTVNVGVTDVTIAKPSANGANYTFTLLKEGTTQAHWVSADGGAKADIGINVVAAPTTTTTTTKPTTTTTTTTAAPTTTTTTSAPAGE